MKMMQSSLLRSPRTTRKFKSVPSINKIRLIHIRNKATVAAPRLSTTVFQVIYQTKPVIKKKNTMMLTLSSSASGTSSKRNHWWRQFMSLKSANYMKRKICYETTLTTDSLMKIWQFNLKYTK